MYKSRLALIASLSLLTLGTALLSGCSGGSSSSGDAAPAPGPVGQEQIPPTQTPPQTFVPPTPANDPKNAAKHGKLGGG